MDIAEALLCALVAAIILVSLLSNVLVLVCFLYSPEIRGQPPGLFTLNLTLCNLLLTVANMPLTLAGLVRRGPGGGPGAGDAAWAGGGGGGAAGVCQAAGVLETFLSANAMLSMAALSIDRWVAVVFPLRYHSKMRRREATLVLGYAWAHSASFSAVAACFSWVGYHKLYASCTLSGQAAGRGGGGVPFVVFTVFFHAFTFLLSSVVLCVTYLKVLKVARFHCKRIDVITMQTLVLLVDIHPRKISTFIGSFMLCFAPYVITSKAACDPFVYSLLRRQYRTTCSDIINRLLKKRPGSHNDATGPGGRHHPGNCIPSGE
ncbi:hypothetical protein NHX12_024734 [Muraenolepis orangiensis]|uniref:G-protein coupled receptors family 1 profile domain-containing protein n=1 Tax=Muraenolepis orangiensis TaxID=630683 RepID=A0A9Q0ELI7_9TELE|nr:hypothetical protein NHX12_024734 [Muraenolepis orangiensis]